MLTILTSAPNTVFLQLTKFSVSYHSVCSFFIITLYAETKFGFCLVNLSLILLKLPSDIFISWSVCSSCCETWL